eukprot:TRINITY_DN197_c0_g1_i1.p1 TRINITY_DN197_c0_g1~~TRINITY_DN197_c0_g1_i1.p1  ORF type:complete len:600 (+),score=83.72 TRINITY_DN197_c0_g1_i1:31-1830(+)
MIEISAPFSHVTCPCNPSNKRSQQKQRDMKAFVFCLLIGFASAHLGYQKESSAEKWCAMDSRGPKNLKRTNVNGKCNAYTVCDAPEMTLAYTSALAQNILPPVVINYQVHGFAKDDGSDPIVTAEHTNEQLAFMNEAYADAKMSFNSTLLVQKNSFNQAKTVVYGCTYEDILNKEFNLDCITPETGFGGDPEICSPNDGCFQITCSSVETCNSNCTTRNAIENNPECACFCIPEIFQCANSSIGNGICNPECNFMQRNWDGGDCCLANRTQKTCRDPSSPNPDWWGDELFKTSIGSSSIDHLNFYIANLGPNGKLLGVAHFPWMDGVYGMAAGIIMSSMAWGIQGPFLGDTAAHEAGHCFGLYHVFSGVSELKVWKPCEDICYESTPSLLTGDLIADTNPTPINYECNNPPPCPASQNGTDLACETCQLKPWTNTPYTNYMAYGDDSCLTHFTAQQHGRMRCYVDLAYQNWTTDAVTPGTIVVAPNVTSSCNTVTLTWAPPINRGTGTLSFVIQRTPPFVNGIKTVGGMAYTDDQVQVGSSYTYSVKAVTSRAAQYFSPASTVTVTSQCTSINPTTAEESTANSLVVTWITIACLLSKL